MEGGLPWLPAKKARVALLGTATGPIVEGSGRHVHWAVDGYSLCSLL